MYHFFVLLIIEISIKKTRHLISGYRGPTWVAALGFCKSNGLGNDSGRESDIPAWLVSNDFVDEASLGLKWKSSFFSLPFPPGTLNYIKYKFTLLIT
jgi:hypothetical protein